MKNKSFGIGGHSVTFSGVFNGNAILGAAISVNGEGDDLVLALHVYPFGGFAIIRSTYLKRLYEYFNMKSVIHARNFGFGLMKGGVFTLGIGQAKGGRSRDLIYIDFSEFLGQTVYTDETIEKGKCDIEMADGIYKADYRVFMSNWKRSLGFSNKMRRISFKLDKPIDMGSGEPLYGGTMPFPENQDLVDAKIAFINSASLERRKRQGKK